MKKYIKDALTFNEGGIKALFENQITNVLSQRGAGKSAKFSQYLIFYKKETYFDGTPHIQHTFRELNKGINKLC